MSKQISHLIDAAQAGNPVAAEQLFAALYHELHRLAEHNLRKVGAPGSLGATTLLHEAYLNMASRDQIAFPDRARFLGYASRAMRGLVIDFARRARAQKRGEQFEITLADDVDAPVRSTHAAEELERLGEALNALADVDEQLSQLVDLHFFCGYNFSEIAVLRGVSERTVQRDWRKARLLLHEALRSDATDPDIAPIH